MKPVECEAGRARRSSSVRARGSWGRPGGIGEWRFHPRGFNSGDSIQGRTHARAGAGQTFRRALNVRHVGRELAEVAFGKYPRPNAQKDPQGFAQWQQQNKNYQNAVSVARNTYADTMQPYVIHEEPKGKGAGGKLEGGWQAPRTWFHRPATPDVCRKRPAIVPKHAHRPDGPA